MATSANVFPHITPAGLSVEAPLSVAKQVGAVIKQCHTLRGAREALQSSGSPFVDWMVYVGGNHIALHRASGLSRVALITVQS